MTAISNAVSPRHGRLMHRVTKYCFLRLNLSLPYLSISQLADWLESYAKTFELNTWTSSTVVKAVQNESKTKWEVLVKHQNGSERVLNVNHLVFATGFGSEEVELPSYPGMVRSRSVQVTIS
jgi:hypothetical protein